MDKIIGMGNALVNVLLTLDDDVLLKTLHLPKGSMQLIDEEVRQQLEERMGGLQTRLATGGSAGNAVLALANLGASVGFLGKIGQDAHGSFFKESYQAQQIDTKLLVSPQLPTGVASTFISPDGERTFATFLGAASTLKVEDLTLDMFKGYTYLFIEGYLVQDHPLIVHAIELAHEAGLRICLDMASYNIVENDLEFFRFLVDKYVDILFANEEEARAYTGKEPLEAVSQMSKQCSIAIVKVGAKGAYIRKGTEEVYVPACDVKKVVDTTGAGDYFAAGFLYGLTGGYSLEKCAQIGSILSAHVIQEVGANLAPTQWDQIKKELEALLIN